MKYFRALTIAGSDSGGGAGIQADLKTFSALGCYGASVITALTAQNTKTVVSISKVSPDFVRDQIAAVLTDIGADAVKIGMVHTAENVAIIARTLNEFPVRSIVLDPVMVAKSGDLLLDPDAIAAMKELLLPLATVFTPNLPEASKLLGREIRSATDMEEAAAELTSMGPEVVILKGGHATGPQSDDCVVSTSRLQEALWLRTERIETENTHGTGCTFSAAIAANLARGFAVEASIKHAKKYLTEALRSGANYEIGQGHRPLNHFYELWRLASPES